MSALGTEIRKLREVRGMSLRALARDTGVSAPFLSDVEHGRRNPNPETLARLARALGVRPARLRRLTGPDRETIMWLHENPEVAEMLRKLRARKRT